MIRRLEEIIANYPAALERGKRASEAMQAYTWKASGEKFLVARERAMEFPILPEAAAVASTEPVR